jgi:hypothetical protein
MTHPNLTHLDESGLQHKVSDAKSQVEQVIGQLVDHFLCPEDTAISGS